MVQVETKEAERLREARQAMSAAEIEAVVKETQVRAYLLHVCSLAQQSARGDRD